MADEYGAKAALGRGVKAVALNAAIFEQKHFDFDGPRSYFDCMTKTAPNPAVEVGKIALKRELERGLASGVSKRTPHEIREAIRKAREAA